MHAAVRVQPGHEYGVLGTRRSAQGPATHLVFRQDSYKYLQYSTGVLRTTLQHSSQCWVSVRALGFVHGVWGPCKYSVAHTEYKTAVHRARSRAQSLTLLLPAAASPSLLGSAERVTRGQVAEHRAGFCTLGCTTHPAGSRAIAV